MDETINKVQIFEISFFHSFDKFKFLISSL